MPVTIAHPAIAVPLRRFGFVLSALVVGSMMPDFDFFLRLSSGRSIGHTLPGIFLYSVPVGLVVLWIYHRLIKFPLCSLLTHHHQTRLFPEAQRFRFFPLSRFAMILLSLAVGAFSHLAWDSFTHHDGLVVQLIPFFKQPLLVLPQGTIRVYWALQYLSSIAGVAYLIRLYLVWFRKASAPAFGQPTVLPHRFGTRGKIAVALAIVSFSGFGGILCGLLSIPQFKSVETLKVFITSTSIASVSSFMVALLTFGILWHFFIPHHKRVRKVDPPAESVPEDGAAAN